MSSNKDFSSRLRRSEAARDVNQTSKVDEVKNARQAANRQIIYAYAAIIEWYTSEDGKINWVENEFGEQEPSCTQDFVKLCRDLELLGENSEVLTKKGKILERLLGENDLGRKIEQKIQSLLEQSQIIETEEDSSGILDLFNEYTYQMWKTYLKSVEESDKRALGN
jgi:hypothetical protein